MAKPFQETIYQHGLKNLWIKYFHPISHTQVYSVGFTSLWRKLEDFGNISILVRRVIAKMEKLQRARNITKK